ncbi:MAG: PAS domain S-box protein, partial [Candidatus Marsarchaeota archaeon]|nr:PAS domain S-box protein [Candidatus Marsarchaeota archaeon]
MQETLTVEQLIAELFMIGKESADAAGLIAGFTSRVKEAMGVDYIMVKDAYQNRDDLSGLEEFAVNTSKPYVDNRLSGYSAFPELIKHYNLGFRSCMLMPVSVEGKPVVVATFLSRQEDRFEINTASKLTLATEMLSYLMVAKIEKERSVGLAKYFDAAFNTYLPQMLIDRAGAIVKTNKSGAGLFGKTQKEMIGKNLNEFFGIDEGLLSSLRSGATVEVREQGDAARIYKATSSRINDRLSHMLLYDVTELKELEEKVRLSEKNASESMLN